jgi:hypothetical protein
VAGDRVDAEASEKRSEQSVRVLRSSTRAQDIREKARGSRGLSPAQVLLPLMLWPGLARAVADSLDIARQSTEGDSAEALLRGVWTQQGSWTPPQGRGSDEQRSKERSDALRWLSHALALAYRKEADPATCDELLRLWLGVQTLGAWQARYVLEALSALAGRQPWPQVAGRGQAQYDWEPPRATSMKIADRRSKLRAVGNAVVPLCGLVAGRVLVHLASVEQGS